MVYVFDVVKMSVLYEWSDFMTLRSTNKVTKDAENQIYKYKIRIHVYTIYIYVCVCIKEHELKILPFK